MTVEQIAIYVGLAASVITLLQFLVWLIGLMFRPRPTEAGPNVAEEPLMPSEREELEDLRRRRNEPDWFDWGGGDDFLFDGPGRWLPFVTVVGFVVFAAVDTEFGRLAVSRAMEILRSLGF